MSESPQSLLREDTRCHNCGAYASDELEALVSTIANNQDPLPAPIAAAWRTYAEWALL